MVSNGGGLYPPPRQRDIRVSSVFLRASTHSRSGNAFVSPALHVPLRRACGGSGRLGRASYRGTKVSCPCSSAITIASAPKGFPDLIASAHNSLAVFTACERA